ncbi:MAG: hypothetical protein J7L91_04690, partial [Candidatus Korarchaeota archaeon]|nr:hypothetical protein [Candidatus Korarchaeota archaeon]
DRRISIRDARIRELEEQLSKERWRIELLKSQMRQLKSFNQDISGVKLTVISSLSKERVDSLYNGNVLGEVLLALDASGASASVLKRIKELGFRAILYRGSPPPKEFLEAAKEEGIPVASLERYRILWKGIEPLIPTEDALELLASLSEETPSTSREMKVDVINIIRSYRRSPMKAKAEQREVESN